MSFSAKFDVAVVAVAVTATVSLVLMAAGMRTMALSSLATSRMRVAMLRRPGRLRVVVLLTCFALWQAGLLLNMGSPDKTVMALIVGAVLGAVLATAADMVLRRYLEFWATMNSGRPPVVDLPGRDATSCAADLAPPNFLPSVPLRAMPYKDLRQVSRFDRRLRMARNVTTVIVILGVIFGTVAGRLNFGSDVVTVIYGITFIGGIGTIGLVGVIQRSRLSQRNSAARSSASVKVSFESVALTHRWRVSTQSSQQLALRWPEMGFLPIGIEQYLSDACLEINIDGWRGWVVSEAGSPASSRERLLRSRQQSVSLMWLPGTRLPPVSVSGRETRYLLEQHKNQRLELEEFNRYFHVQATDARSASAVLSPRLMEHLLVSLPDGGTLRIAGDAATLVVPEPLQPWRVEEYVAFLSRVVALLPSYYLREYAQQ
jgi:hypothetical protein